MAALAAGVTQQFLHRLTATARWPESGARKDIFQNCVPQTGPSTKPPAVGPAHCPARQAVGAASPGFRGAAVPCASAAPPPELSPYRNLACVFPKHGSVSFPWSLSQSSCLAPEGKGEEVTPSKNLEWSHHLTQLPHSLAYTQRT
ncbi:hypothetical protein H1C71_008115 [Ictidomys tridecemlineatus]|nr:hypothetical protein H1C71_008115 [Ictidomys tridecemlineatus]KAG3284534.1 hypothetical protein H1C71_008115 [Ictidomys tridecemlineatus]KAG3284535.1 hypothetical protein H1C71_008115 [Ictidomys tridecemlineatus]KAG3284536.1 hypothetical protein H1C71_008115 [Ictidomys tridecemlineatus]